MFLEKLFVPNDDILKLIMFGSVSENYTVLCQGENTKKNVLPFCQKLNIDGNFRWKPSYISRILFIMLDFVSHFNHGLNDMVRKIIPVKMCFTVNKKT